MCPATLSGSFLYEQNPANVPVLIASIITVSLVVAAVSFGLTYTIQGIEHLRAPHMSPASQGVGIPAPEAVMLEQLFSVY